MKNSHTLIIRGEKWFLLRNGQKILTDISPKKLHGTNKQIKVFSTLLVIRNIQIQTRYYYLPFRMAKKKKKIEYETNVG